MGAQITKLLAKMFHNMDAKILMVGLDAAGKVCFCLSWSACLADWVTNQTTILYKLKLGEVVTTIPTIGFNVETVEYKRISVSFQNLSFVIFFHACEIQFTVWDVGGQTRIRPLWRHYFAQSNAIIYVVDSADEERLGEAKEELDNLLNNDELRDATLLVLANKQDMPQAVPIAELTSKLGLRTAQNRKWYVQSTCAVSGDGIFEGLDWLASNIRAK